MNIKRRAKILTSAAAGLGVLLMVSADPVSAGSRHGHEDRHGGRIERREAGIHRLGLNAHFIQ